MAENGVSKPGAAVNLSGSETVNVVDKRLKSAAVVNKMPKDG